MNSKTNPQDNKRPRKRYYKSKNRKKPSAQGTKETTNTYLEDLSQVLKLRQEFFNIFGAPFTKKMRSAKNRYYEALKRFRSKYRKEEHAYPLDSEYSENHFDKNIDSNDEFPEIESKTPFFHEKESQKEANFQDDTEESLGTREDYEKYKEQII
jgi:hypothetical protein